MGFCLPHLKHQKVVVLVSSKILAFLPILQFSVESDALYDYVEPYIKRIDSCKPSDISTKVKVFINGCWVGISDNSIELYENLKMKKYSGIINIYTSIFFNYAEKEIRICNDGGRMVRTITNC